MTDISLKTESQCQWDEHIRSSYKGLPDSLKDKLSLDQWREVMENDLGLMLQMSRDQANVSIDDMIADLHKQDVAAGRIKDSACAAR